MLTGFSDKRLFPPVSPVLFLGLQIQVQSWLSLSWQTPVSPSSAEIFAAWRAEPSHQNAGSEAESIASKVAPPASGHFSDKWSVSIPRRAACHGRGPSWPTGCAGRKWLVTGFLQSSPGYVGETAHAGHLCHGGLSPHSPGVGGFLRALGY